MLQLLAQKLKKIPGAVWWLAGLAVAGGLGVLLAYYWRVFYYLDARGWSPMLVTAGCCGFAAGLYLAVSGVVRFAKRFETRAALCILLCGVLFVFASAPMQVPDESGHFLRAYAISRGHLDFDAARAYPEDVGRLIASFPAAWVSSHISAGIRLDTDPALLEQTHGAVAEYPVDPIGETSYGPALGYEAFDSTNYALKQYGEDGVVLGVADGFLEYFAGTKQQTVYEPLVRMIAPYLPAAAGMALARLFGFAALGCLYAGRLANLCVYTLLCWLALKNCKRYQPAFLAFMLLPLSLYLAASLNYDALLLGCYYLAASYYCREELSDCSLLGFAVVFWFINSAKPWINLLWLALPLVLPAGAWRAKMKRWQFALLCVVPALAITRFVDWYGAAFMYNYGEIGRMLPDVDQLAQLRFVLKNPLRYCAVLLGTLYENELYLGQLGVFGALDLSIPVLNQLGMAMLLFGAVLSSHEKATLRLLPGLGLGALAVVYGAGALTALYITYTPVGMIRILGVQARYLLPVFLLLCILLAAVLGRVLQPRHQGEQVLRTALACFGLCGALGAVLLFQHYFIGPVYII